MALEDCDPNVVGSDYINANFVGVSGMQKFLPIELFLFIYLFIFINFF